MFLPQSRQMTAMGKEGVYLEDHEEHLAVPEEREEHTYSQSQYSPGMQKERNARRAWQQQKDLQDSSYLGETLFVLAMKPQVFSDSMQQGLEANYSCISYLQTGF